MPTRTPRIALLAFAIAATPAAGDTVTLRPASGDGPEYALEGTIADYRGDAIVVRRAGGAERSYPAERVVRIDTAWPAAYESSRAAVAAKQWARAAELLTVANRQESRPWARRIVLTELLRCRLALGQTKQAGDLLIALDTSDPATPAWGWAPVPWYAADDVSARDARAWLARREPSARLLGAAWLLNTPDRSRAQSELRSLTRSDRSVIATLAECQLWRLDLVRDDPRQTDRWARRLATLPGRLAAGPRHLLAQAFLRQKRYDEAALAALESALGGRAPHRLTARGLLLAGRAMQAAGRTDEARTLLQEVARDYADTPQKQDAELLLAAER